MTQTLTLGRFPLLPASELSFRFRWSGLTLTSPLWAGDWAIYSTSLSLSFSNWQLGIILPLWGFTVKFQRDDPWGQVFPVAPLLRSVVSGACLAVQALGPEKESLRQGHCCLHWWALRGHRQGAGSWQHLLKLHFYTPSGDGDDVSLFSEKNIGFLQSWQAWAWRLCHVGYQCQGVPTILPEADSEGPDAPLWS